MHEETMGTYAPGAQLPRTWGTWPPPSQPTADESAGARTATVRAIVVYDQAVERRSLCRELRLEPDLEVVGEANTAAAGVALAQDQRPDIVVMNVEMPDMDGVQAAEQMHALAPDCLIMLLTDFDSIETHERGRAAGARVVLQKGNPAIFKSVFRDLVRFVRARHTPAWPEIGAAYAQ